ncbi:MAG: type II toxin-antitoxin system RelE/ParE family toxin [Aquisalinus sp.]|nr:type II toxin-antitoxin system RelE/ParE family toxin [Aquisalinus sp.]
MAFDVRYSEEAVADFQSILIFLADSYEAFGEPPEDAFERAVIRTRTLRSTISEVLSKAPHRGTLAEHLLPNLRHTTIDRAVIYFDIHEVTLTVHILAVFYGGQDHQSHMLRRLL